MSHAPSFFPRGCRQMVPDSDVHEVNQNGDPDDGNNGGMDVREKLEKIRFEQPDGFFVVNDLVAC